MRDRARFVVVLTVISSAALLTVSCGEEPTRTVDGQRLAPFYKVSNPQQATDRYIVVLTDKTDVRATAFRLAAAHGGRIRHIFDRVLGGFSVTLPPHAVDALRANPAVLRISQVGAGIGALGDHTYQLSAPWALDRIDQRTSTNSWYSYSETGSGVRAYIIDSGIRTAHTQFGGRASVGFDANPQDGQNGQDCLGHGTEVAGVVGGSTYGVAKSVTLISVRVASGCINSVFTDDFIAGMNWVANNNVKPAVANASIWYPSTDPAAADMDQAASDLVNAGVPFVVIAGNNSGADACNYTPARVAQVITVAATNSSDARAAFSNIGTCVDIFAPGRDIISSWYTSNTATHVDSGTSFAAPHVAGAIARLLQFRTTATPSEAASVITSRATQNALSNIGTGSPNLFLYTRFVEASVSSPVITSCGSYTWTASGSGYGTTFTYGWERWVQTGFPPNGGFWGGTVPGQNYTTNVCPGDNTFHLRATATNEYGHHGSYYVNGS